MDLLYILPQLCGYLLVYNKSVYTLVYYYDLKYVYDIYIFCWIFDQMQLWISNEI